MPNLEPWFFDSAVASLIRLRKQTLSAHTMAGTYAAAFLPLAPSPVGQHQPFSRSRIASSSKVRMPCLLLFQK